MCFVLIIRMQSAARASLARIACLSCSLSSVSIGMSDEGRMKRGDPQPHGVNERHGFVVHWRPECYNPWVSWGRPPGAPLAYFGCLSCVPVAHFLPWLD